MAREKKEETEEQKEPEAPKKTKWKLIIFISIVAVVIAAGGIGGYFIFFKTGASKTAVVHQPAVVGTWPMDPFIVNISDGASDRYLKLVIQLEISDATVIPELDQIKPKLRDIILDLLTSKTYKELMDLPGKQRLREDIAGRVNNILIKGKVTKVYFTDFVVQ